MVSNRTPHRRIAWLLVVALFVATLAPWAATTRAAAAGLPGLHDLCLADGSSRPAPPDAPADPSASGHCPLCVLNASPGAPPPALEPVLRVPAVPAARPTLDTLPPARETASRWRISPPRAPPLLG
jgi:hypothetical protein